ncbi:MAG: DUF6261 family protein [Bacteroidales bacterium]|nr:DUF6261 family protein [Bacteroidales bacterium]
MIKVTPSFSYYNQSECIQYLLDAEELCKKQENTKLAKPLQNFSESNSLIVQAYKKDKKSNITAILTKYDQRRDNAVICLRLAARTFSNHFADETRKAAHTVLNTMDKYGKRLHKLNYQSQTTVLSKLYNDLTTKEGLAALEKIHMTDVAEEMQTANNLFNTTYLARVEESAANNSVATGVLIKQSIDNYRHLVALIEAYHIITPSGGYDLLLNQLNQLAIKYNGLIKSKKTTEEDTSD